MRKFREISQDEKVKEVLENIFPTEIEDVYLHLEDLLIKWNNLIKKFNDIKDWEQVHIFMNLPECQKKYHELNKIIEKQSNLLEEKKKEIAKALKEVNAKTSISFENMDDVLKVFYEIQNLLQTQQKDYDAKKTEYDKNIGIKEKLSKEVNNLETDFIKLENEMVQIVRDLQELSNEIKKQVKIIKTLKNENGTPILDKVSINKNHIILLDKYLSESEVFGIEESFYKIHNRKIYKINNRIKYLVVDKFIKLLVAALEYKKAYFKHLPLIAIENLQKFKSRPEKLELIDLSFYDDTIEYYLNKKLDMIEHFRDNNRDKQEITFQIIIDLIEFQRQSFIYSAKILNGENINENLQILIENKRLADLYGTNMTRSYRGEFKWGFDAGVFISGVIRRGEQLLSRQELQEDINPIQKNLSNK